MFVPYVPDRVSLTGKLHPRNARGPIWMVSRETGQVPEQLSRRISLVRVPRLSSISNWSLLVGLASALRGELFHITLLKYLDLGCFVFCMKDFAISSRVALLNHKHCGAERRSLAEIWTPSDPDRNVFASERVSGERR